MEYKLSKQSCQNRGVKTCGAFVSPGLARRSSPAAAGPVPRWPWKAKQKTTTQHRIGIESLFGVDGRQCLSKHRSSKSHGRVTTSMCHHKLHQKQATKEYVVWYIRTPSVPTLLFLRHTMGTTRPSLPEDTWTKQALKHNCHVLRSSTTRGIAPSANTSSTKTGLSAWWRMLAWQQAHASPISHKTGGRYRSWLNSLQN